MEATRKGMVCLTIGGRFTFTQNTSRVIQPSHASQRHDSYVLSRLKIAFSIPLKKLESFPNLDRQKPILPLTCVLETFEEKLQHRIEQIRDSRLPCKIGSPKFIPDHYQCLYIFHKRILMHE